MSHGIHLGKCLDLKGDKDEKRNRKEKEIETWDVKENETRRET